MSDTPRTDAAEFHVDDDCSVQDGMVVSSEVSRKLEIELAEAIRVANYWKAEASKECTLAQRANKERDELRAEIERLKARTAELTESLVSAESREDAQKRQAHSNYADYREALAEVERLKADKARLDWLEKAKSAEYCEGPRGWSLNGWSGPYHDTLRAAIDAAMKGPQP